MDVITVPRKRTDLHGQRIETDCKSQFESRIRYQRSLIAMI